MEFPVLLGKGAALRTPPEAKATTVQGAHATAAPRARPAFDASVSFARRRHPLLAAARQSSKRRHESRASAWGCRRGSRGYHAAHARADSGVSMQAAVNELAKSGKVCVVGYCYGGTMAWAAASRLEGVAVA